MADLIKKADPTYTDLHHEIATTGGADQEYMVKSGDTLSAICLLFYGNANKYPKVAEANGVDPNKPAKSSDRFFRAATFYHELRQIWPEV